MCVAVPAKVIEVMEGEATVDFGGIKKRVNTMMVPQLTEGEYVLLHAGCAMQKIDEEEAKKTLEIFRALVEMEES
jgi:hydrogenase expression/formation protein HypC